jgi:hypothetical protein
MTQDEHVDLLKQAIAANLAARGEHDKRRDRAARGKPVELKIISAAQLIAADPEKLHLDAVIEDPVRKALRAQLRDLGERLHRLLPNTDAMLEVAEEVADIEPERWGRRIDLIDKAWDGIGHWVA